MLWPETVTWLLLTFVQGLNELENPSNWMAIKSSFWNQWKAWPPCTQSQASPMTGLVLSRRIWVNNPGAVFAGAVQGTVIDLMFCWMKLNIWLALGLNILWKHISDSNMYTCEHWNIYLTIFYFHWQNVPKVLLSCVFFFFLFGHVPICTRFTSQCEKIFTQKYS